MAIRAPMMKEPESATDVFAIDTKGSTGDGDAPAFRSGWPVDMIINRISLSGSQSNHLSTRLMGSKYLVTNTTAAESNDGDLYYDYMNGYDTRTSSDTNNMSWMWKRAKGYFDAVAYTGSGTDSRTLSHSLGVVPEMMIVKRRGATGEWKTYHHDLGNAKEMVFNGSGSASNSDVWDSTTPTDSQFTVYYDFLLNISGEDYIACLFASLDGISKVGSYTGTGSALNIDCGFSNGARFVLIKCTSHSGHWGVFDTERGIVAGNDAMLQFNETDAENTATDHIDPYSSGFALSGDSEYGGSGREYIYLAIA
jgi:hypothetical protein